MKRSLLLLLGTLALVGLIWLFNRSPATPKSPTDSTSSIQTPAESNTFSATALNPALTGSTLSFLDQASGRFVALNLNSNTNEELAEYPVDLGSIHWSPTGQSVLSGNPSTGNWSIIRIDDGFIQPLHEGVETPSWSPDGTQLLYQFISSPDQKPMITSANADGKSFQNITPVTTLLDALWWSPLKTYAIGLNTTTNPAEYELIAISSKSVTRLTAGPVTGELKWSPSGKLALLDTATPGKVVIADVTANSLTEITVASTVSKLAWESETSLIGLAESSLVRADLPSRQLTTLREVKGLNLTNAKVVGLHNNQLILIQSGALSSIPLK